MPPKKKLKPLAGQTQLSFAKRPKASQHQEQEAATAIEKDDVTANDESAQAKSKERRFFEPWLKTYSWLVYEKNGNYMYCKVCTEAKKSNGISKEGHFRNFQNTMLNQRAKFN